jgi:hypothetical protein
MRRLLLAFAAVTAVAVAWTTSSARATSCIDHRPEVMSLQLHQVTVDGVAVDDRAAWTDIPAFVESRAGPDGKPSVRFVRRGDQRRWIGGQDYVAAP